MTILLLYLAFTVLVGVVAREQLARVPEDHLEQWLVITHLPSGLKNKNMTSMIIGAFWPLIVVLALVPDDAD